MLRLLSTTKPKSEPPQGDRQTCGWINTWKGLTRGASFLAFVFFASFLSFFVLFKLAINLSTIWSTTWSTCRPPWTETKQKSIRSFCFAFFLVTSCGSKGETQKWHFKCSPAWVIPNVQSRAALLPSWLLCCSQRTFVGKRQHLGQPPLATFHSSWGTGWYLSLRSPRLRRHSPKTTWCSRWMFSPENEMHLFSTCWFGLLPPRFWYLQARFWGKQVANTPPPAEMGVLSPVPCQNQWKLCSPAASCMKWHPRELVSHYTVGCHPKLAHMTGALGGGCLGKTPDWWWSMDQSYSLPISCRWGTPLCLEQMLPNRTLCARKRHKCLSPEFPFQIVSSPAVNRNEIILQQGTARVTLCLVLDNFWIIFDQECFESFRPTTQKWKRANLERNACVVFSFWGLYDCVGCLAHVVSPGLLEAPVVLPAARLHRKFLAEDVAQLRSITVSATCNIVTGHSKSEIENDQNEKGAK